MFGICPYTVVTEKYREAMKQAQVNYVYVSIYEITFAEVKKLLGDYLLEKRKGIMNNLQRVTAEQIFL